MTAGGHNSCARHEEVACLRERPADEEQSLAFGGRALSPRQHGIARMLAWRHGVDKGGNGNNGNRTKRSIVRE